MRIMNHIAFIHAHTYSVQFSSPNAKRDEELVTRRRRKNFYKVLDVVLMYFYLIFVFVFL